jgi:hypothetical protein
MLVKALIKYPTISMMVFLLSNAYCLLWIETSFNATFDWTHRNLSLAIPFFIGFFTWWNRKVIVQRVGSSLGVFLGAIMVSLYFYTFGVAGYVSLINFGFSSHPTITFQGLISSKFETGTRIKSCVLRVFADNGEELILHYRSVAI